MDFVKFPKTHWLSVGSRRPLKEERYLRESEAEELFAGEIHISEKMDGANVGMAYDNGLILQKRGGFVGTGEHPQYGAFKKWANDRRHVFSKLGKIVLFGEWLYAKHSIHYTRLPDYFMLFDVYRRKEFVGVDGIYEIAHKFRLRAVPTLYRGTLSIKEVPGFVSKSCFSDENMEGVVVRKAGGNIRGKYVRPDFIQGQEHWSARNVTKNLLRS